ncbi:MAG: nickel/cobalt exporter [Myxococcota bacterium]
MAMVMILWTATAVAHPFDARWYGHRLDVRLQPEHVEVDFAIEVPMVDLLADLRRELDGVTEPGPEAFTVFNAQLHRELRGALRLIVDDQPVSWEAGVDGTEPRFENQFAVYGMRLRADLPEGSQTLNLINGAFPDEPSIFSTSLQVGSGLIVDACSLLDVEGGQIIASRDGQWRTEEDNRELRLSFRVPSSFDATISQGLRTIAGEPADSLVSARDAHSGVDDHDEPLQALLRGDLTPATIAWAFLLAIILGAVHALSPGHGKTLVAAYLLGERQTIRHAFWLGIIVTVTHTLGVYVLGGLALLFEDSFPPEILLPWMTLISGLLVLIVGIGLVRARLKAARPVPAPAPSHDHGHDHGHSHGHDHGHDHSPEPIPEPIHDHGHSHGHGMSDEEHGSSHAHEYVEQGGTWWGIVSLGVSGGLAPCPSALVLLLTAVSFHRTLLGLALIVAFSLGLAALVTAVGVGAVLLGDRLRSRGVGEGGVLGGVMRWVPVGSAVLIFVIGVGITVRGVGEILSGGI